MKVRVFATRIGAIAWALAIRNALGYPRGPGTNVGGGVHCPPLLTRTRFLNRLRRNGTQWAVVLDDATFAGLDEQSGTLPDGTPYTRPALVSGLASCINENATWRPKIVDFLGNVIQTGADEDTADPE